MASFNEYISEYRKQLEKGTIKKAYKGLMEYIMDLRTHFKNKYPDYFVSGQYLLWIYRYDVFFIHSKIITTSKIENSDSFSS